MIFYCKDTKKEAIIDFHIELCTFLSTFVPEKTQIQSCFDMQSNGEKSGKNTIHTIRSHILFPHMMFEMSENLIELSLLPAFSLVLFVWNKKIQGIWFFVWWIFPIFILMMRAFLQFHICMITPIFSTIFIICHFFWERNQKKLFERISPNPPVL